MFVGLICLQGGVYWVDLMSYYSSGWSLILIGLIESIVFPWIYGLYTRV